MSCLTTTETVSLFRGHRWKNRKVPPFLLMSVLLEKVWIEVKTIAGALEVGAQICSPKKAACKVLFPSIRITCCHSKIKAGRGALHQESRPHMIAGNDLTGLQYDSHICNQYSDEKFINWLNQYIQIQCPAPPK